ncbi:hypothetical protein [Cellulomonas triticagri]|uniref:hypothetical protein n=1 Tax=Cellulomonas triticagri TaxID=2483352 RepID=UPI0018F721F5|nr:hypothetical protein [Cellulomonas triticagri]
MRGLTRAARAGVPVLAAAAAGVGVARARSWHLRWGATPGEVRAVLPGDEVPVARVGMRATRAVTVDAPPTDVWPWLAQIGTGKAGWYSYDLLDNLGRSSAREVLPRWQSVAVGDAAAPMNPFAPVTSSPWRVEHVDQGRVLVWRHPQMGTWSWVLLPGPGGRGTRLVSRLRLGYESVGGMAFAPLLEVADFPMFRRMLLGIKERAEALGA